MDKVAERLAALRAGPEFDRVLDEFLVANPNNGVRAMMAARLSSGKFWSKTPKAERRDTREWARLFQVGSTVVTMARRILAEGTPEEIALVVSGTKPVMTIGDAVSARRPQEKRQKNLKVKDVGKNPERFQRQAMNAQIWGALRDALNGISSLPRPEDVLAILSAHDKTGLLKEKLSTATLWLMEFEDAWNRASNKQA